MISTLQLMNEWGRFCVAAGQEYIRTGLICLPPSWLSSRRVEPYSFYARLRESSPVHRSSLAGGVIVSRAEDIARLLRDERFSSDVTHSTTWQRQSVPTGARALVLNEGNDHRRGRKALAEILDAAWLRTLSAIATPYIERHVSRLSRRGTVECMEQFVLPLVRELGCELLGIPPSLRDEVANIMRHGLTFSFHHGDRLLRFPRVMASDSVHAVRLRCELRRFISQAYEHPNNKAGTGLLASLRRLVEQAVLSQEEAWILGEEVSAAWFEPTAYALGNSLLALADHPEIWDTLHAAPEMLPQAVRELMRYDSPVQAVYRYAREEIAMHDQVIHRGENVLLLIGSANRDPAWFRAPNHLVCDRKETTTFTFGMGRHACLGANLSQSIVEGTLSVLLERNLSWQRGGSVSWRSNLPMRGLQSLPLNILSR